MIDGFFYGGGTHARLLKDLDRDLKKALLVQLRNLWTHTSTAMEGNTLSLGETAFVLEEGLTIAGKPLKDHQEVVGHARAIDLVYACMAGARSKDTPYHSLPPISSSRRDLSMLYHLNSWMVIFVKYHRTLDHDHRQKKQLPGDEFGRIF